MTTDQKVVGSIPAGRAIYFKRDVAQLGSALDLGSRVAGSNPVVPTIKIGWVA